MIVFAVRLGYRPLLVLLALLAALVLAAPLVGAKGGNSEGAKACQKGGWSTLAPAETPGVAFESQGACVAYSAKGKTPVPWAVGVPTAYMEWGEGRGAGGGIGCQIRGWLVGDTTGIVSVQMDVWFQVEVDGEILEGSIPVILTPPAFDTTTEERFLYLVGVPTRVTAVATYTDDSTRSLPTSYLPLLCGEDPPA